MKISLEVWGFAVAQGVSEHEALEKGMETTSVEFVQQGAEAYQRIDSPAPASQVRFPTAVGPFCLPQEEA